MTSVIRFGGVPEHFNLPWHLAIDDDAFAGGGVSWTDMPGGTGQMMQALADGDVDAVVALTEGAMTAIATGTPARIVRNYTTSPLQWGVHTAAGAAVTEDSIGPEHQYAVSRLGSGSHLMAHVLADRLGHELGDDNFVVVDDIDGARRALAAGDADLFLWDRFMTAPLVTAGELDRIAVQPTPWPAFVTVVHIDLLDAGRSVEFANLLDAAAEAADELVDRDDRAALVAERYGLTEEVAEEWFEATEFDEGEPIDEDDALEIAELLQELGLIDDIPEIEDLVFPL